MATGGQPDRHARDPQRDAERALRELMRRVATLEQENVRLNDRAIAGDQAGQNFEARIQHEIRARDALNDQLQQARQDVARLVGIAQQQQPQAPAPRPPAAQQSGNKVKVNTFSNAPDEDWLVWKHHFEQCRQLNKYNDNESRLALAAAMKGRAAAAVMDLTVLDPNEGIRDLLRNYENRFLPASASQLSRVQFEQVTQNARENILDFHARLRQLWNKAYPHLRDETMLIRKFSLGLRRADVRRQVIRTNPQTYGDALEAAQNEASVAQVCSVTETGAGAAEHMEIGAMIKNHFRGKKIANLDKRRTLGSGGSTGKKGGTCHFCGKSGHWKNECHLLGKAKKHFEGRRKGSSAPRGNSTWKKNFHQYKRPNTSGSAGHGRIIALIEEIVPQAELDEMSMADLQELAGELGELAPELQDDAAGQEEDQVSRSEEAEHEFQEETEDF